MNGDPATPLYTRRQRAVALLFGLLCHTAFAAAIAAMALSLFRGLTLGLGRLTGASAWLANFALLASFPLVHTWLLSKPGRVFLARFTPMGLGRELYTTTFALVTALHLLAVFLLWSPTGHVLGRIEGPGFWAVLIFAAGAWLLLARAMSEAQLGVQTGALGWWSVWRNRKPVYQRFPTSGLHGLVRQPIYIAFAMLLWLTSVWTADELVLAGMWTMYCIGGSARKERRYLGYYGDLFRSYQSLVPFWIPRLRLRRRVEASGSAGVASADFDVVVVGAGPVGLLLALELAAAHRRVLVVEKRCDPPSWSMAIGITPPSLAILRRHALDEEFVRKGLPVRHAAVSENGRGLGEVRFDRLPSAHPFILVLPQSETVRILRRRVEDSAQVSLSDGVEFVGYEEHADHVHLHLRDVESGADSAVTARLLVGCDGAHSRVRDLAGFSYRRRSYGVRFAMADFDDDTGYGDVARLFFTRRGSVESFPLPGQRRRWIVQASKVLDGQGPRDFLIGRVGSLAGHDLRMVRCHFESTFEPCRALAAPFARGRVALCGDAAHQMSPIGGQGMNTGFADAALLAGLADQVLAHSTEAEAAWSVYTRVRTRAFNVAASRAARGMWLGTRRGRLASFLRGTLISRLLFHPRIKERLAPYFAMLTLPPNPQPVVKGNL